jgi:hypothetical protein
MEAGKVTKEIKNRKNEGTNKVNKKEKNEMKNKNRIKEEILETGRTGR